MWMPKSRWREPSAHCLRRAIILMAEGSNNTGDVFEYWYG
jgi:hypothetical protein